LEDNSQPLNDVFANGINDLPLHELDRSPDEDSGYSLLTMTCSPSLKARSQGLGCLSIDSPSSDINHRPNGWDSDSNAGLEDDAANITAVKSVIIDAQKVII
jgi:hypothetical protein